MRTSVAVPTYRRPASLIRCLEALESQVEDPFEVLVVVREGDVDTRAALSAFHARSNIRPVIINSGGLVSALNSALQAARGDVIAITDDDAVPRPDWLSRLTAQFSTDARIGAVGGRDVLHPAGSTSKGARTVGKVQWFGRVIGNHHVGVGPAREVEILKGVNMSFRRTALDGIGFDVRLRGNGAQVHNDMAMSLAVKRRGWTLVYDPAIVVDHYPAERFGEERRGHFDKSAVANAAHNETLALLDYLPRLRRITYLGWAVLVGSRSLPGVLQVPRLVLANQPSSLARFQASMKGRFDGYRTWRSRTVTPSRPVPTAVIQE
jgi:cellulose synthase/poly-beta-1,6-N-acetylglucosamine synthase-like glycosyltransferase